MDPLWLTVKQLNTSGEDGLCRRPPPPPPPHHNFPPSSPQPFHQRPNGWGGYFPLRINVHEATGVVNKLLLTSRPLIAGIVRQLVGPPSYIGARIPQDGRPGSVDLDTVDPSTPSTPSTSSNRQVVTTQWRRTSGKQTGESYPFRTPS
jgi:hypothetical protein